MEELLPAIEIKVNAGIIEDVLLVNFENDFEYY